MEYTENVKEVLWQITLEFAEWQLKNRVCNTQ